MEDIKIVKNDLDYKKVVRNITINAFNRDIQVCTWYLYDSVDEQYDGDYAINEEDIKGLTEEQIDILKDFIVYIKND